MSLQKAVANALSFAHLAGIVRTKGARAESESDDEKDKGDDKKGAAKAEDEDDDTKAEGDDKKPKDTGGDEDDAKAENDKDEDDKDEDDKKAKAGAFKAGYAAANSRAATVFASPAAARNIALAAELVFNSSMSAQQITSTLALAGQTKGGGLADRMAGVKAPTIKAEAESSGMPEGPKAAAQATVAAILKASAKARGEKA